MLYVDVQLVSFCDKDNIYDFYVIDKLVIQTMSLLVWYVLGQITKQWHVSQHNCCHVHKTNVDGDRFR